MEITLGLISNLPILPWEIQMVDGSLWKIGLRPLQLICHHSIGQTMWVKGSYCFKTKLEPLSYVTHPFFTLVELELVLKSSKLNKQPGPDLIRMELFKWLDGSNRLLLLDILNQWWKEGGVPKEVLHARVVPIFKKGDIDDPSNYRPISLLNSIYKLFTALIRARIQSAVEFKVSPTQFGFRPRRSTAHAAFIIRRLQDWSEQKNSELIPSSYRLGESFWESTSFQTVASNGQTWFFRTLFACDQ